MPFSVFISYAHRDRAFREELEKHLSNLRRQNIITSWYDGDISPGSEWESQISKHLNTDQIILLLISADFIASDFCYSTEMTQAIARHDANQARVLPIILRPTDLKGAPFAKLKVLPTDGNAVTRWPTHDDAFVDIVQGIRQAIDDLTKKGTPPTSLTGPSSATGTTSMGTTQVSIWNVPFRRNPFFTGREPVFSQIHTLLHAGKTTALSQPPAMSGLGGIGKTQTAVEYAFRNRDSYQYVLWVQANDHETLLTNVVALARLLDLPEKDVQEQQVAVHAVKRWFETHANWLLIFDNADDLAMVSDYIPADTQGHVLLTTRAQAMGGLARKIELDTMKPKEGAEFLLRRADIIPQDATLERVSKTDRAAALDIVRALGGLALDQAGAYIDETKESVSNYLTIYQQQRATLLKQRGKLVSGHSDSVATTWSLAFARVERANPAAIELMRFCAFVTPDAIPEELILEGAPHLGPILQPVAADRSQLNAALAELLSYSLVRRNATTHTLTIHRLVQAVIQDDLGEETRRQWAERVVRATRQVFPFDEPASWPRSQRYLPQALVCADLITEWNLTLDEAAALLNDAGWYLKNRGQYREAVPLMQRVLSIGETRYGRDHPDTCYLLNNLAALYMDQGKYEKAEPLYQRALAIEEQVFGPEHPLTASTLNNLACLYANQGKDEEAAPLYQHALTIYEQVLGLQHPSTKRTQENYTKLLQKMEQQTEGGDQQP